MFNVTAYLTITILGCLTLTGFMVGIGAGLRHSKKKWLTATHSRFCGLVSQLDSTAKVFTNVKNITGPKKSKLSWERFKKEFRQQVSEPNKLDTLPAVAPKFTSGAQFNMHGYNVFVGAEGSAFTQFIISETPYIPKDSEDGQPHDLELTLGARTVSDDGFLREQCKRVKLPRTSIHINLYERGVVVTYLFEIGTRKLANKYIQLATQVYKATTLTRKVPVKLEDKNED